jgi:hypothetical protein
MMFVELEDSKKEKLKDELTERNMRHSSPLYEISSLSHTF